jgi:hypothetical protein
MLISLSYRYLPVFPQEPELNPTEMPEAAPEAELTPSEA